AYITLSIVEDLLTHVEEIGAYFMKRLMELKDNYPFIRDVRGVGLMIGMELSFQGRDVVKRILEKGFLINCTAERVLRFLPPLIIEREHIDALVDALEEVFSEIEK
ncbi:MAG TPA: aminotransferase class III-fold pyridoxal phosphate-dependent enzyme, partial [Methanococcaceae archaeon]|nr:aminotransferase class III-fold pyridoxal phosphate-dependent enzyme [Methanococcaceae archaeon]